MPSTPAAGLRGPGKQATLSGPQGNQQPTTPTNNKPMANKLTWDAPALSWDSPGAFWDGTAASPRTMKKVKAVIDFTRYTDAILAPTAQTIHDEMLAAAATFADPPVAMAALATLISTYNTKLAAKASRATADINAFKTAREALEDALAQLGGYVNSEADGDGAIVELSGFPSYGGDQPAPSPVPAAPENVRIKHGAVSGSIVIQFTPDRRQAVSEVQLNPGDPNTEAGWKHAAVTKGGKASISSLPVGSIQWARVRTYGPGNTPGAWSDPAKIVVT
jgi:hypothetical protein